MIAKDENGKYLNYAWPGGYPVYHICNDGEALCPKCANDPKNPVHEDMPDDGWRIIASDINYEDDDLFCAHCGEQIKSAYGD